MKLLFIPLKKVKLKINMDKRKINKRKISIKEKWMIKEMIIKMDNKRNG